MRWPGREDIVAVRREGVRDWGVSVVSVVSGKDAGAGMEPLDCGCQEGMRLGGTIIVERRFVSMTAVGVVVSLVCLFVRQRGSGGRHYWWWWWIAGTYEKRTDQRTMGRDIQSIYPHATICHHDDMRQIAKRCLALGCHLGVA
jgi:hypothetical protein